MPRRKKRATEEINSSSMADIAFLLLIFFLVTTTVLNEKGIWFTLPKIEQDAVEEEQNTKTRNIFKIILNSNNELLVDGEDTQVEQIRAKVTGFLNNRGQKENWSESPQKAIISFRSDRGTTAAIYIQTLDGIIGAYNDLSAAYLGLTTDQFLALDRNLEEDYELISKAEKQFPRVISEAKPSGE